ncbi:hypothetical protein [Bacillus halotolerans]|uniref:hypothetical protein n=1 Tax=Bacillus halotolerans TaxID=260554 RepID=UPI004049EC24
MNQHINYGCYVCILSDLHIDEPSEGLVITDTYSKVHYELQTDTPCDRSDLLGLDTEYQTGNLTILMDIKNKSPFTHIVKDSEDFLFAVKITNLKHDHRK